MNRTHPVSPAQFAFFRIVFGAYLAIHFATQLPHAVELFSNQGVLSDPALNPLHGLFPNPLALWDSPAFTLVFISSLLALSLAFTAGFFRRTASLLLWFGWAALFNRNNLIANPSLPYVGLILLFCALIPPGEPWSFRARRHALSSWYFPGFVFWGAWLLLAAGYTASGIIKLESPSWVNGTAFLHLLENPLARPGFVRDLLVAAPSSVHAALTWSVIAMEILFLPLCAFRTGRLVAWSSMLAMHIGILTTVDFADLSFGMVMIHLFTFDPRWFPARRDARQPVLLFDGECGLCNAAVRLLLREDTTARLRFAPLQSPLGQAYLRIQNLPTTDFDSLVFVPDWANPAVGDCRLRTDGALAAAAEIGGVWRALSALRLLPRFLRDPIYKLVARTRYALFGDYVPTPLPDPNWEHRFIA